MCGIMEEKNKKKANKWAIILVVLAALALLSFLFSSLISVFFDISDAGNVAMVDVDGVITLGRSSVFSDTLSSDDVVGFIKKADENPAIKAIIININSPGGSPVGTDEIANAIKKANKTTVAVIREVGASGGYWIASSADHVIANRMSITGSIGVIGSYLEFSGLLERYNMTYERLVAGKYKDIGTPLKELAPDERKIIQGILDELHNGFIVEVANNRKLPESKVREIATGVILTGKQAKELGLVDELGGIEEAKIYVNKTLNITPTITEYKKPVTLADIISEIVSKQSFSLGEGIGSALVERRTGISI